MAARRLRKLFAMTYGLLLGAGVVASAQSASNLPKYRYRLLGVYDADTGVPIVGAKVTDVASGNSVMTSETGTVSLFFVADGGGYVAIRKLGYESWQGFVRITATDTAAITLILRESPTELPTIITRDTSIHWRSAGLRDFEMRRKHGLGNYIPDSTLRKNEAHEMADLLRSVPGVNVSCSTRTPRRCIASSVTGCGALLVYRDGVRLTNGDLSQIPITEIAGVEVYTAATAPAQYSGTGAKCGVVLFWTRERLSP